MSIETVNIPDSIHDKKVAIIGYGLIGNPTAHCLRDRGYEVKIGLRSHSTSYAKAQDDGFEVRSIDDVAEWADAVFIHIPDDQQGQVYKDCLNNHMPEKSMLVLAHGYSFLYGEITPRDDIDAVLIAPHGPGKALRELFLKGDGLAAQIAVQHDYTGYAENRALILAHSLGHHKGGISIVSVKDEVIIDNFAEQMVLCGGVVELMRAAYLTLVNAGYDPKTSYESIVRELKYTVDIIHESGPDGLYQKISKSALIGSLLNGKESVGHDARIRMKQVLSYIEKGDFSTKFKDIMAGKVVLDVENKLDILRDDFK